MALPSDGVALRVEAPADDASALHGYSRMGTGTALVLLDAVCVLPAWVLAVAVLTRRLPPEQSPGAASLVLPPLIYLLFLYALGLYRRAALLDTPRALGRLPLAAGLGGLLGAAFGALLPPPLGGPGGAVLCVAAIVGLPTAGAAARAGLYALRQRGVFHRRILVIGAGRRAHDLAFLLRNEGRTLSYDLLFVADAVMGEQDARLSRDPRHRIVPVGPGFLATARRFGADEIVVAPDERRGTDVRALLACKTAGFPVSDYPSFLEREIRRVDLKRLDLSWLLYADGFSLGLIDRALKRGLDIAASAILLLLSAPFLLAAALAVRLHDGGPILYRQDRVTQNGRVFRILKLRSMAVDAERGGAVWATAGDRRVTRIGRLLRRTRLDELPQLVNILRGDMSFVGPRPERPEFVADLAAQLQLYDERHIVKAGLTGWAQVNYPYGASLDDARSKLSYDLYYVKNISVLFDLLIILQTIRVVLWPDRVH
jgi:sugar transferase (PEP-CTERM system associated)